MPTRQGGSKLAEEGHYLSSPQRSSGENLSCSADSVHLEDILGQVDADSRDLHRGRSKLVLRDSTIVALQRREREPSTPSALCRCLGSVRCARFDEVPDVAVELLELGDRPIWLSSRWLAAHDALREITSMIAGEVVRLEEHEDRAAALPPHSGALLVPHGSRAKEGGVASWRANDDSTLTVRQTGVLS